MAICGVKSVLKAQTLTCEKLREETVALDNRVSAIENLEDNSHARDLGAVSVRNGKPTGEGALALGGRWLPPLHPHHDLHQNGWML